MVEVAMAAVVTVVAILAAVISVVEVTAISAVEATASATRISAAGTMAVRGSQYHIRFRTGVFTAIARLPDTAVRISARSETPRWPATR
jgi:hypothetical protein